VKISAAKF